MEVWTHESMTFEACGFKRFYLSDNSNKRCSLVFLQKSTIGPKMALSGAMSNEGGWPATTLTTYLDSRLLNALPIGWQQLIKQVKVSSSAGKRSKEIVTANNYFFIPSIAELVPSMTDEPYIYERKIVEAEQRINKSEHGSNVTMKALLALLSHGIDGNAIEPMKEAKAALENYLIDGQNAKNPNNV